MKKLKDTIQQVSSNTKITLRNAAQLVEAIALLVVGVYSAYSIYHSKISAWLFKVVLVSAVIIGLRGAYELLRHLANKGN